MEELQASLPNNLSMSGAPATQRRKKPTTTSFGGKRKASVGEDLWQDFDFVSPNDLVKEGYVPKRKRSRLDSINISENDSETCPVEVSKHLIVKKIMVMGLRGAGKHFLVNSAFHSQDEGEEGLIPLRQTMDFVLKTEAAESSETKYHFWIRELNDRKFESVVKVYYKIATLFIFVYSVTDRSSFEVLDEAIGSVLKEIPREKFTGVLLANRSDLERNCEVSHAEGVKLKEKYNLSFFMDTGDGEVRERLLEVLNK